MVTSALVTCNSSVACIFYGTMNVMTGQTMPTVMMGSRV